MPRRRSPTDLSDAEWMTLAPLVTAVRAGDRPAMHDRREIVEAILSVLRAGGAWHLLVDTMGLVSNVHVHAANIADRDGAKPLLVALGTTVPHLAPLWADARDQGRFATWVTQTLGWSVEIMRKPRRWVRWPVDAEPPPVPAGFPVVPRRWVVERTFAWLGRYRRLSTDDEALPETEAAWIYVAMSRLMVAR